MTTGGQGVDTIADDATRLGQSFDQYADGLYTAQAGMQRARDIAVQGGLQVTDTEILDPGPEQQDYQRKIIAFNQAKEEADRAKGILLHKSILKKESARLLDEAKVAESRYLSSPGGG